MVFSQSLRTGRRVRSQPQRNRKLRVEWLEMRTLLSGPGDFEWLRQFGSLSPGEDVLGRSMRTATSTWPGAPAASCRARQCRGRRCVRAQVRRRRQRAVDPPVRHRQQ